MFANILLLCTFKELRLMETCAFESVDFDGEYFEPCNDDCAFCFFNYTEEMQLSGIFKRLNPHQIRQMVKKVRHQVRRYNKGEIIALSGDRCADLKILLKGSVHTEMMDFQGNSLRIERIVAPNTIAPAFIFGDNNVYPVDVIAEEDSRLLMIPKEDLMELFCEQSIVLQNYLDIISNRSQFLTRKIRMLGLQTIRGKIAHYLLELSKNEKGYKLIIKNTQSELANMFGVSRPSLARVIREMHHEGIIQAIGKEITILDKKALSDLLT